MLSLLAAGAEVDAIDHRGDTPLLLACECGHTALAGALLTAGARLDVQVRSPSRWRTCLPPTARATCVLSRTRGGGLQNNRGRTALMRAAAVGDGPLVDALVKRGGGWLAARDEAGDAALEMAVLNGHDAIVETLRAAAAAAAAADGGACTTTLCATWEGCARFTRGAAFC